MGYRSWIVVLLCLCSCARDTLVFVSVSGGSWQVDSLQVRATHGGEVVSQGFGKHLEGFTIQLPPGAAGTLTLKVEGQSAKDQTGQSCTVAVGQREVQLVPSAVHRTTVELVPAPLRVDGFFPTQGPRNGGQEITIRGQGFGRQSIVRFDGREARQAQRPTLQPSPCEIKVILPAFLARYADALADAAPDRVRQQLADHGLIPEEWGGDTIYVNVSALRGENIDKLLEQIAVSAEMLELRANPDKAASGLVIEARLDRNRGPMATILIQEGTLRVGDIVVAGRTFGKVRAMLDDQGTSLEEAGPSTPIEVLGLDGVPEAGDQVNVAEDDKIAKQVVEHRRQQERKRELGSKSRIGLETLMERNSEGATKELKVVLKADVQGSAEALKASLTKLSTEKVKVHVIAAGVGGITESDVNLAKAGGAIIVGFHVRPAGKSAKHAEQEEVEIRLYDIIYDALDEVKAAMAGLLAPIKREVAMGKLAVRDTFSIPKMGTVAGCMVTEGRITRKAHLRIIRDAIQVYEGKVASLRRFKDDVSEVQQGYECGVMVAGWNEIKKNDVIEAYEVIEEAAQL